MTVAMLASGRPIPSASVDKTNDRDETDRVSLRGWAGGPYTSWVQPNALHIPSRTCGMSHSGTTCVIWLAFRLG